MKKIAHLLYSGLGGHASVFFSLLKADRKGAFATEAIFCGVEEVRNEYILQCQRFNIPYQVISKKQGINPVALLDVYKAFKKASPDTIFLHGATFILPAILYKLRAGVNLVVRDTQAPHLKTKREWFWLRLAARFADHLVFLTEESLQAARERINRKSLLRKSTVIPNGLDLVLYSPAPAKPVSQQIVIGMQSRLQSIKDHPTLLRAFAGLKQQLPHYSLRLRIAGDGETRPQIMTLTSELGLVNEVEFCGMLDEKELLSFMQSLDLYVHATFGETMSNSIMQAMACGLPIVASDVWGVSNMIRHGDNGLLYPSADVDRLRRALAELIENDALRKKLSLSARAFAEKEYDLDILFERYGKLL